jgi:hypothetical protein
MALGLRRKFLLHAEGIHHRGTESTKVSLGVPEDTLPGGFGRREALRVANTSILKQLPRTDAEFRNPQKRGQPLQQTFPSPADLGALCLSVVKSSSSAISCLCAGNVFVPSPLHRLFP